MRRIHALPLVAALVWGAPPQGAQHPVREVQRPVHDAAAEDVEIMRRLLARTIDEAVSMKETQWAVPSRLDQQLEDASGLRLRYLKARGSVSHSRAFFSEGYGALFTFDVSLPVSPVEADDPPPEREAAADDGWSEVEREVRGQPAAKSGVPQALVGNSQLWASILSGADGEFEIDPESIEAVREAVRGVVEQHGLRIEALGQGEGITVALHLEPVRTELHTGSWRVESPGSIEPDATWANLVRTRSVPARTLILHFPFEELDRPTRAGRGLAR